MSSKSSFAIIIPCYNEQTAIATFTAEVVAFQKAFSQTFADAKLTFVFVDNNSTDQSWNLLNDFASKVGTSLIQVIRCETQGYGAALKAGFNHAESTWYGFADLDNTYPLQSFIPMLQQLEAQPETEIIFANRLHAKNGMPWIRRLGNLFYAQISKVIFLDSVGDMCTGMRIFTNKRKNQIVQIRSNDLKFSIQFTAMVLKEKWNKKEFAITYRERIGPSKLSVIKDGVLFLYILLSVKFSKSKV